MVSNSASLIILFALAVIGGSFANICDLCDCQPSRNEVFSVTCGCEPTKNLFFSSNIMKGAETASMVIVRNCRMVNIERNSFSRLDRLDTLAIQNSLYVSVAAGAFSSLNSLLINSVQDVSFSEMAFMGARGIKNIIINSSNMTQLPKYSLYDIEGIERLTLGNVSIGQISHHAVNATAKNVILQNVNVNHIETNGLNLKAQMVLIKNSDFFNPAVKSINIDTEFQTRFLNNRFGNIFQINITSPFAEFSGNSFENFHTDVFKNIQMSRVMNNTILRMDSYLPFETFNYKDFYDNYFECGCGMNLLKPSNKYDNYDTLKNNFCLVNNCTLSIFEFGVESVARCNMRDHRADANSFCNDERIHRYNNRNSRRFSKAHEEQDDAKNISVNKIEPRFLIGDDDRVTIDLNSTSTSKGFSLETCMNLFVFTLISLALRY